ncbi:hypothetical protein [Clostridium sardiniense]|uniref:hypothetical protein n=1 Tax=Clostridium sardiniense TaxID=29369 RepID=UPI003D352E5B
METGNITDSDDSINPTIKLFFESLQRIPWTINAIGKTMNNPSKMYFEYGLSKSMNINERISKLGRAREIIFFMMTSFMIKFILITLYVNYIYQAIKTVINLANIKE